MALSFDGTTGISATGNLSIGGTTTLAGLATALTAANGTSTTQIATTGISVTNSTTGVSGTNANLPPYYALAYIMKS